MCYMVIEIWNNRGLGPSFNKNIPRCKFNFTYSSLSTSIQVNGKWQLCANYKEQSLSLETNSCSSGQGSPQPLIERADYNSQVYVCNYV
jgi:hypothetical protein